MPGSVCFSITVHMTPRGGPARAAPSPVPSLSLRVLRVLCDSPRPHRGHRPGQPPTLSVGCGVSDPGLPRTRVLSRVRGVVPTASTLAGKRVPSSRAAKCGTRAIPLPKRAHPSVGESAALTVLFAFHPAPSYLHEGFLEEGKGGPQRQVLGKALRTLESVDSWAASRRALPPGTLRFSETSAGPCDVKRGRIAVREN